MSFWSSQTIIERNKLLSNSNSNSGLISNFDQKNVKESSYTLRVGNEAFITSNPEVKFDTVKKLDISEGFCYIPPGQFAYLITDEEVRIPIDCLAFISMKFKTKAAGLVNVSGFHVDPGYKGKLIFAVYNAGIKDIPIRKGMDIFLIWFSNLDEADERPKNIDKGYKTLPSSILENSQNADTLKNLSDKIKDLEIRASQSSFKSSLLLALLIPFNFFIFRDYFKRYDIYDISTSTWLVVLFLAFIVLFRIEIYFVFRSLYKKMFKRE